MGKLQDTISSIEELDFKAMLAARERQDQLTKPAGALGVLEELSIQLAGIMVSGQPAIGRKTVIVMVADHGVVEERVSAYPAEVTKQMVANFASGGAAINVLARHAGADVVVVDIGVNGSIEHCGVDVRKVRCATANMAQGPAMSCGEAVAAIEVGIEIAEREIARGATLLGTGDMGIGNTTASSAILAVFTGLPLNEIVGAGTGLDGPSIARKRGVIEEAILKNNPDPDDPIDVLSKVGGLEIAGLTGVILGAAAKRVPVVVDGFISGAAALVAWKIAPIAVDYMVASHVSVEPGHRRVLEILGLKPMLHLNMRLGEGTGAVLGMHLVEAAARVLNEMATFSEAGVAQKQTDADRQVSVSRDS